MVLNLAVELNRNKVQIPYSKNIFYPKLIIIFSQLNILIFVLFLHLIFGCPIHKNNIILGFFLFFMD